MKHKARLTSATLGVEAMCLALGLAGCVARYRYEARTVQPSGFLGTYSQLHEGKEGEALLVYIDRSAPWHSYDKVLIEPVTIWGNDVESRWLTDVPKDERQVLVDCLDASLHAALAKDFAIVDRPGAGTLRVRVALTEAEGSTVPTDVVSTFVPHMRGRSGIERIATGTAAFVGNASVEGEMRDSVTEQRLAAGVDRRVDQKRDRRVLSTWADVEAEFDAWSEQLRARLAQLRAG